MRFRFVTSNSGKWPTCAPHGAILAEAAFEPRNAFDPAGKATGRPLQRRAEGTGSLGVEMVLPRRIELPTPSLPRTCSTTELRQHRDPGQRACPRKRREHAMHGPPRQGLEMSGFLAAFHGISMIPPSIEHLERISTTHRRRGVSVDSIPECQPRQLDPSGGCHDRKLEGAVAALPEPPAPSSGYPGL